MLYVMCSLCDNVTSDWLQREFHGNRTAMRLTGTRKTIELDGGGVDHPIG